VTTPTSGASQSMLNGVSCANDSACTAVGSSPKGILAQQWNGTAWSISLDGPPARPSGLDGIWCTSGPACMAVGFSATGGDSGKTLAARWNGTAWTPLATPNPGRWPISALNGIACTAASNCWAVGGSANRGTPGAGRQIIEHWNGTKWSTQ
jgi:hypothetical protein